MEETPGIFTFLLLFFLVVHVRCQTGFLSIDCGLAKGSDYQDAQTQIEYTSDAGFVETGTNNDIAPAYVSQVLGRPYRNLRSFPEGGRNCYNLKPVTRGSKYLLRAHFMYGNYDGRDRPPQFDLYLGVQLWWSVKMSDAGNFTWTEIITVAPEEFFWVCLVNTGQGTPFVSALEMRLLEPTLYPAVNQSQSLSLFTRLDPGAAPGTTIRYKDDPYDRIWSPWVFSTWTPIQTNLSVDVNDPGFEPAAAVMKTAVRPINDSGEISFYFVSAGSNSKYHLYLHFAELEQLARNETREFRIFLNNANWYALPFSPSYLSTNTIYSTSPLAGKDRYTIRLSRTTDSTLPPIFNGVEIYVLLDRLSNEETYKQDVDAMMNIKTVFGIKRNWVGDPCIPLNYGWEGLNCSYQASASPRIISIDLSSSGLSGQIPTSLDKLTALQSLDLSSNNLSGPVPDFLGQLPLRYLNLTSNKLSGSLPKILFEKSKNGTISLSAEDNLGLCASESCQSTPNNDSSDTKKKNRSVVVPVVASVGSLLAVSIMLFVIFKVVQRRKLQESTNITYEVAPTNSPRPQTSPSPCDVLLPSDVSVQSNVVSPISTPSNDRSLKQENRRFSYGEIMTITNNFERVIGKGGFGTVYHGYMKGGTQVAVKILSMFSTQGSKEFRTEAELLMRVHHRNLASFIGYCDEGYNKAIMCEYMPKGNLKQHLSGSNDTSTMISWINRLRIAVDAAQGLEYLHNGCTPSIIHRDVKTTNILLNEKLEAKIADFGLSKVFPEDNLTHISTQVMGTPGYLDPEYYVTNKLNEKSDVYSFGVVLLELITGKPPIIKDPNRIHLIQWVNPLIEKGEIRDLVDPRLEGIYDMNSAWKALEVAMECIKPAPSERPTMTDVLIELKECLASVINRRGSERTKCEEQETTSHSSIEMGPRFLNNSIGPGAR